MTKIFRIYKILGLAVLLMLTVKVAGQQMYLPIPIGQAHGPVTIYWKWNATYMGSGGALIGGNLTYTPSSGGNSVVIATLPGGTTGKTGASYYFEVTVTIPGNNVSIGIENSLSCNLNTWMGADSHGYGYYTTGTSQGHWDAGTITFASPPYDYIATGNTVGVLYDGVGNTVSYYLLHSGTTTFEGTFTVTGATDYYPAMSNNGGSSIANFGASGWLLSGAPFGGTGWAN